jgi:hypothetical protein
MIQMVGRGLRTVDPNEHPGIVKRDCIVLDFGTSSQIHGCLEQDVDLDSPGSGTGQMPTKTCPECEAEIPIAVMECPICGHLFTPRERSAPLTDFVMTELDLLKRSSFQWCDLFGDDAALLANGFHGWAGAFFMNGTWLAIGERLVALAAADDWLNTHETDETAHKSRRWLREPPTEKQLAHLPPTVRADLGMTRYQASALLTFKFNRHEIRRLVMAAQPALGRAA